MRHPLWAALLVAAAISACTRQPAKESAAPPQIGGENCRALSSANHKHCGANQQDAMYGCMALARLAEVGGCVAQTLRSFDCATQAVASCGDAACCKKNLAACEDVDMGYDHCLRGYCSGHTGNPDCTYTFPPPDAATP